MKRSSCLSALLVGLSLTTASAALAAPTASTEKETTKQVALAEPVSLQQDPAPSGGTAPAPSTAAAPAAGESTPSTPAVSVGTSTTPATDTPAAAAGEPAAKPKPRPWAGSSIFIAQSMTTNTVFRGQTQYADPTAEANLWITPRYSINEALQLRGRLIVSYEYTNSDSTTYRNEPQLSDTTLQLFYKKIPKLPGDIQPAVALNASLPTSKNSRARTLIFSPGATLQLARGFEKFIGGEAMLLGSLTYSHPIYSSRNPEVSDARPYGLQCMGGGSCSDLLSGTMNASDTLSYSLVFSPEWGKWNPAIMYLGASQWAYHPKEVRNPVDGSVVGRPAGFEPTSVRQTHYVSAWVDYNFNSWLTGEVGFWNAISALGENGQRANLIFDRYQDTRVYLGASIQIDNLVKTIQGGSEGEGGIVRAKNNKAPMFAF